MAGEAAQPLISAGPFLGVNNTEGGIYISPTKGRSMSAGDCEITPKYLVAKAGRTRLFAVSAGTFPSGIGTLVQSDRGAFASGGSYILGGTIYGSIPIASTTGSNVAKFTYQSGTITSLTTAVPDNLPFTSATVVNTPFFTPQDSGGSPIANGQRSAYTDNYGVQVQSNGGGQSDWTQFFAPEGPTATITSTGITTLAAGTYTYYVTRVVRASTSNSGGQETSASLLGSITIGGSGAASITLTPTAGFTWTGTIPTDSTAPYFTNLYRSSTNQSTAFFVGRAPNGTTAFVDSNTDATISNNAQITFNRDVPPVRTFSDNSTTIPFNGNIFYAPGAPLCLHQGRAFYFVLVSNGDTNYVSQIQLWYSNLNRGWEFDKINNVFLVDIGSDQPIDDIQVGTLPSPYDPASNIYAFPQSMFVEVPSATASLVSTMVFWTTKRMYILYGNSPATYVFQKFADLGCQSMRSVAYSSTENNIGLFFMSENGIYFTNAQSIQYISEDIRSVIDALSYSDRYNCVGFYANHTYYISFPQRNETWAYRTTTGQWHGPMPYSTISAISIPSDPAPGPIASTALTASGPFNEVVGVNNLVTNTADSWFTQVDTDLGLAQIVTYQTHDQVGQNPHIEKTFTHVGITHKLQSTALQAVVTVTVDNDATKVCSVIFDLRKGPVQIGTLSYAGQGNTLRGYVANMTISFITAVGNATAPIQIKNVTVYGRYGSMVLQPTLGLN